MTSSWSSNRWDLRPTTSAWPSASIVIPAYGHETRLEAVLEALARQDYPGQWEVLVVDDGTDPPLAPKVPPGLDVTIVRQERAGFGAGRARHAGALRSRGDVICFLDSDMLPFEGWLSAHAEATAPGWVLGCGTRRHVAQTQIEPSVVRGAPSIPDLFAGERYEEPAWIEGWWERTDDGRRTPEHLWRVTSSGSQSVSRDLYFAAGGYSADSFVGWGGEDNEFGYRVLQSGGYIRPVRDAQAWHLGPATAASAKGEARLKAVRRQLASRIPDAGLPWDDHVTPHVPETTLCVRTAAPSAAVIAGVGRLLADVPRRRLGIVVHHEDRVSAAYLTDVFQAEGSVHVGAMPGAWRFARVRIEAQEVLAPEEVVRLAESTAEGQASETLLLADDGGTRATASLVRVDSQIERGVVQPGLSRHTRRLIV